MNYKIVLKLIILLDMLMNQLYLYGYGLWNKFYRKILIKELILNIK